MKAETPPFLFFPSITYFAMPMALLAMTVNLRHLAQQIGWSARVYEPVAAYGLLALLLLSIFYFQHLAGKGRTALIREWHHPFQLSFFPLMSISWFFTAVLATAAFPQYSPLGEGLFWGVLIWHGLLNLLLINRWLFDHQLTIDHLRPPWFILLSGDFVAVISGYEILGQEMEWMWFFYGAALFMWFVFVTLLLYRLIFVTPIEESYRPSLFIFLAPPSLACTAALELFHTPWHLSVWGPYAFATFMLGVWLISGRRFLRNGISMTSWSYIFPLAAYGLANQYLYEAINHPLFLWIALAVMGGMVLLAGLITGWLIRVAIENLRSKFA